MIFLEARWLAVASLALVATACDVNPTVLECAGLDAATPVQALTIESSADPPVFAAGGVTIALLVTANIPCLRGGTTASVSTSTGTIGGNTPDKPFSLYLAPTGDAGDTHLEGYVELVAPYDRTARVDAVIGEVSATTHFGPYTQDAGAP